MNILEQKDIGDLDYLIKDVRNIFKINKVPIKLNGSASLKSQSYPSDYDFSVLLDKPNYNDFYKVLEKINNNSFLYFIELKIQLTDGRKIRCHSIGEFTENKYNKYISDVDFIKVDICIWNQSFIEASCIYMIDSKPINIYQSITDDIHQLMIEGKYYKVLKRIFNLEKLKKTKLDYRKMSILNNIFNSEYGILYSKISSIEAALLVKNKYHDKLSIDRVNSYLNFDYKKFLKDGYKKINSYALTFL